MPLRPPDSHDDPLIGLRLLDQYRIERRLGAGGMGAVYLAHQEGLDRQVAVKFLLPEIGNNADACARFFREAQSTSRLIHPNVVQIFNFGDAGEGRLYLAMELVAGPSLKQHMRNTRLTPPEACELAIQIADALALAHGLNIIHRDLKPDNVLLQPIDDRLLPKVVDFGIAKLLQPEAATTLTDDPNAPGEAAAQAGVTRAGQIFGTPEYMAPEQVTGEPVDARADIFALGVILYEMLAGRRPIEAPTPSAHLLALFSAEPRPLSTGALSPIPRRLNKLVMAMLRRNAAERPASMREVRNRLAHIKNQLEGDRRTPTGIAIGLGVLTVVGIAIGSYVAVTDFKIDSAAPTSATFAIAQQSQTPKPTWVDTLTNDTADDKLWTLRGVARRQPDVETGQSILRADLAEDLLLEMAAQVEFHSFAKAVYLPIITAKKTLMDALETAHQRGDHAKVESISAGIHTTEQRIGKMFEERFADVLQPKQTYWEKLAPSGQPTAGEGDAYYDVYGTFSVTPADLNLAYYQESANDEALGVVVTHFFPALLWQHDVDNGAVVLEVRPDSPAAKADVRIGDVLFATDGAKIDGLRDFRQQTAARQRALLADAGLQLTLSRGGSALSVTVRAAPTKKR